MCCWNQKRCSYKPKSEENTMMKETASNKKYWIFGIIGCICFGIGDWLLGYVDPTLVEEDIFYFIRGGHGADYNNIKVTITMAFSMVGMLFYPPSMIHIADVAQDKKTTSHLKYTFGLCSIGWLVIHFIVAVNVMIYSWMMENAGSELANGISNFLGNSMLSCLCIAFIFVGIPLILLIVYILCGKTNLKRWEVVFTPLIWMIIIAVMANIIPTTAFSYGLYTFCMNSGMLVWFIYLFVSKR